MTDLHEQVRNGHTLIGIASVSGIIAKHPLQSGANFLLMLNSIKFRQMGRGSLAGLLPFSNSNDMVMDFTSREILPLISNFPIWLCL